VLRNSAVHFRRQFVGYLALFIALGGTTYAATTVGSADIKDNAVLSRHIKNGQVKHQDLAVNSVGTGNVIDGSLFKRDFKAGQLPAGPRGPSNSYYVHGNVLSDLPAGDYVVIGQWVEDNSAGTTTATVTSLKAVGLTSGGTLIPGSSSPSSQATVPPGGRATVPFQAIIHLPPGGTIDVSETGPYQLADMTAVRVGSGTP